MEKVTWSIPRVSSSATTGKGQRGVPILLDRTCTNVRDAGERITELRAVLRVRACKARTPYQPEAWLHFLSALNLIHRYAHIPNRLRFGFMGSVPTIHHTYFPPNSLSLLMQHDTFAIILNREYSTERYIGPLSRIETEILIGPFQTAPLSMVPKPSRPEKVQLVQNLSYPLHPTDSISSINSAIDSDLYPCTWGTASTICLLIWFLPPGSQAAVRDVAEAYRMIPLHPSQWPGLVVKTGDDSFTIDCSFCFSFLASAGTYGEVADAGADIFRSQGIGPMSKWVDDHLFIRILQEHLKTYNAL